MSKTYRKRQSPSKLQLCRFSKVNYILPLTLVSMTEFYKGKNCQTSKDTTSLYARLCMILVPFFFFFKSIVYVCHDRPLLVRIGRCNVQVCRNISHEEEQAAINLRNEEDLLITLKTRSDKGGQMVVMTTSHMDEPCSDHLKDTTTYLELAKDPTSSLRVQVNKTLKNIL